MTSAAWCTSARSASSEQSWKMHDEYFQIAFSSFTNVHWNAPRVFPRLWADHVRYQTRRPALDNRRKLSAYSHVRRCYREPFNYHPINQRNEHSLCMQSWESLVRSEASSRALFSPQISRF